MAHKTIDKLGKKSIELLKAETAALLFNLGKTHFGFWGNKIQPVINEIKFKDTYFYEEFSGYKDYYEKEYYKFDMQVNKIKAYHKNHKNELFEFIDNTNIKIGKKNIKFLEIMKGNASNDNFVKNVFFRGCENINSGIDKGSPKEEQQLNIYWLSNAFGSFKEQMNSMYLDEKRRNFFENLFYYLNENKYFTNPCWSKIRKYVFDNIKQWYSHLLSDSRYPINDITLWDQAYMTATMFKSALAAIELDNNKYSEYLKNPQKIKWCILGIQYDKKSLYEKALKCNYVQAYRKIIEEMDNEVKDLIEIEYALGNEIYRDETGIYFLAPENILGKKAELEGTHQFYYIHEDLLQLENKIFNIFKERSDSEIFPCILCTEPSRGLLTLSHLLESAKSNLLYKRIYSLPKIEKIRNNICQVCGVRTVEKYDGDYHVCSVCFDRRQSRVETWIDNLGGETVWTGELQDENGKVALLTFKFDLDLWLNGEMLSSLTINDDIKLNGYKDIKFFIENMFCNRINFSNEIIDTLDNYSHNFENLKEKLIKSSKEVKKYIGNVVSCSKKLKNLKNTLELFNNKNTCYTLDTSCKNIETDIYIDKNNRNEAKNLINIIRNNLSKLKGKILKQDDMNELHQILDGVEEKIDYINKLQSCKNWLFGYNEGKRSQNNIYGIAFDAFIGCCNREETLKDLFKQIFINPAADRGWISLFNSDKEIIDVNSGNIKFDQMTDEQIELFSKLLFQILITKSPSPARLKRIWDSTQNFMEEIIQNADNLFDSNEKYRNYRLIFQVDSSYPEGIYKYKGLDFYYKDGKVYLITSLSKALKDLFETDDKVKKVKDILNKNPDLDQLKSHLNEITIEQVVDKKVNKKKKITLKPDHLDEICRYKPVFTITSPSPVSTQCIVPADQVNDFIEKVQASYMKHFKWVYGKLPLHIGVVIQNYKMPLYLGIKALRKMERSLEQQEDIEKTALSLDRDQLKELILENEYSKKHSVEKDIYKFYSLYKTNDDEGFEFLYLNKEARFSVPFDHDTPKAVKYTIYPNTIDFEFLDTTTRINDIYYDPETYKRSLMLKKNRPYTWEQWEKFALFKDIFHGDLNTKMNHLIHLIYSKLYDWQVIEGKNYAEFKTFCASLIYNTLELNNERNSYKVSMLYEIFDIHVPNSGKSDFVEAVLSLEDEPFVKSILMFLDMYEFWHKALREV